MSEETDLVQGGNGQGTSNYANTGGKDFSLKDIFENIFSSIKNVFGGSSGPAVGGAAPAPITPPPATPVPSATATPTLSETLSRMGGPSPSPTPGPGGPQAMGGPAGIPPQMKLAMARQRLQQPMAQPEDNSQFLKGGKRPPMAGRV